MTAESDNKQKGKLSGAKWFYLIVAISLVVFFVFHCWTQSRFADSYESIMNEHNAFCKSMAINDKVLAKDSVLILDASMLDAIKVETKAFESHVELLYSRINDQQTGLTLWASALMIVFLVFSIYSMYKIDEIQKQGHESITKIHELHRQSIKQVDDMEKRFKEEHAKIIKASDDKLGSWKEAVDKSKDDTVKQMNDAMSAVLNVSRAIGDQQTKMRSLGSAIQKSTELTKDINEKVLSFQKESDLALDEFKSRCNEVSKEQLNAFNGDLEREKVNAIEEFRTETAPPPSPQPRQDDGGATSEERYVEAFDSIEQQATPDANNPPDDTEP